MRRLYVKDVDGASGDVYYYKFAGTSSETKPTRNVATGSEFLEVDTDKKYVYDEDSQTWFEEENPFSELKTEINSKQDAPSAAGTAGQVLGLATVDNELVPQWMNQPNVPSSATSEQIKAGTSTTNPITPGKQDESIFYGLAKLAGVDLASGSDTVGVFPSNALTAIQKMLGIYEAPWEVIREDSFTNATETDYTISVDDNGETFQLTSGIIIIWIPSQESSAIFADYGRVYFNQGATGVATVYLINAQSQTVEPNSTVSVGYGICTIENSLTTVEFSEFGTVNSHNNKRIISTNGSDALSAPYKIRPQIYFDTVKIGSAKGTFNYRLLGRRKWN